jgi:hypothetical protein
MRVPAGNFAVALGVTGKSLRGWKPPSIFTITVSNANAMLNPPGNLRR